MSVNKAVHKLNVDLHHLRKAQHSEKSARNAEKKATHTEKSTRAKIAAEVRQLTDSFESGSLSPAQSQAALGKLFALGQKDQRAVDSFHTAMSHAKSRLTHAKKAVAQDRHHARKDLKPAEYHMGLKQTNRDRKELGLHAVKQVVRPPEGKKLSKAVNIALKAAKKERSSRCYDYTQAFGARTNYGHGPLTKHGGRITFDCSGFVGAVYKAAGLPAPYTVGYTGTSFDVAGCKNMKKVSESNAKPGDVVVFPDHIALYIGHGRCVSMGQEGEPAVVTVAAEAAYHNRGIQGFYHPRHA